MSDYHQNSLRVIPYNPQLDGLRFCAVLFVLCYHWLPKVFPTEMSFLFIGFVNFFFVLSSYLITKILIFSKAKANTVGASGLQLISFFLFRRSIRIFPAYYLYLIILLFLPIIGDEINKNAIMYFSYLSNYQIYFGQIWPISTAHLWTLAVEEQYYIIWPIIIIFTPEKYIFNTLLGIIIFGVLLRVLFYVPSTAIPQVILTQFCIDPFAIGGLLAYKYSKSEYENHWLSKFFNFLIYPSILIAIISIFVKSYYASFVINNLIFSIISYRLIEIAIFGYKGFLARFLENRFILYLGKISYGIYLYHLIIPVVFWKLFNKIYSHFYFLYTSFFISNQKGLNVFIKIISSEISCFIIYFFLTTGIAMLSWNLVEKQFNKLKFLFNPAKQKQV
ncbi:acyltransferase family protein [Pedobacter lithocola]|uniref:Acyltransferase family protein n=1 Tax=Pedobacter lithocola TaxID=1908239 RepID=A0ABV8PG58_9SPHI